MLGVGAGGGCLDIFSLICHFSLFLLLSGRRAIKPKTTNQPTVPRFWITPLHFILTCTDNQRLFIVARAFYAHVLCPRQDKI